MTIFNVTQLAPKLRYYGDVVYSFYRKSAVNTMVVFKMRDSLSSARYSPVCNVLRQWKTSLILTYRVYRLYDYYYYYLFIIIIIIISPWCACVRWLWYSHCMCLCLSVTAFSGIFSGSFDLYVTAVIVVRFVCHAPDFYIFFFKLCS